MHLEALRSKQKKIFEKISEFPGFYLVGGTALALQIGHRISIDFDLFSSKNISPSLIGKVRRVFKEFKVKTILDHPEQLSVVVEGVKVDFVKYKFPVVLGLIEFKNVKMLKVPEIAAMKAYALNYRGTFKDYVDLYFILKDKHSTLTEIKRIADKKYKQEFNFRLFLEQLIYLKDLEKEEIKFLKKKVSSSEIEDFFKKEVKKIKF